MDALLLMGHGSRDDDGVGGFLDLVAAVRAGARWPVEGGVLEFPGAGARSIQDAIDLLAASGGERIVAVPLLLHEAGHSRDDMPAELARARARHSLVDFRSTPALSSHPALLDAVEERVRQVDRQWSPGDPAQTAVLLVGRGTTTSLANAEFYKAGRLLWERLGYGLVECCFVSLAAPGVAAGIDRCVRLGARRVLVVPYFLHTGVLVKRIEQQAGAARSTYDGVDIGVGEPLGSLPSVVQIVLDQARPWLRAGQDTPPAPSRR